VTPDEIAKCIPDEVVMPIAWAIYQATTGLEPGDERYEDDGYAYHWEEAITALASGLAAWPRMAKLEAGRISPSGLFLPLKQEGA